MTTTEDVQSVDVEVTLTSGLRYSSVLPADSPILHDLYAALAASRASNPPQPAVLLQLPLNGGRTACSFISTSLISVTTSPPVLIQPQMIQIQPHVAQTAHREEAPGAVAPAYVRIDDFLTPDENKQLLDFALANEAEFTASTVTTNVEDYRKSRVLFSIAQSKWEGVFVARLKMHLPHIGLTLNAPNFRFGKSEIQVTASNDGDFFKVHPDAIHEGPTADREITYVYYLHRMPRPYSGGNLLLYEGEPGQPSYDRGKAVISIAPQNNCLIAFASNRWHEVEMVRCPSAQFGDSRFTVNGWLHRQTS